MVYNFRISVLYLSETYSYEVKNNFFIIIFKLEIILVHYFNFNTKIRPSY